MPKHHSRNNGGRSKRDRGRRKGDRPHPSAPRAVSVERVDDHTLIVRVPEGVRDEDVAGILLDVQERTQRPIEAAGVWLTPEESTALSTGVDVPLPGMADD